MHFHLSNRCTAGASSRRRFGMDIPGWPPENIEEMAKKLEQEMLG
jgi:hypothetical protein